MSHTTVVPDRARLRRRQWAALSAIVVVTLGFAGWALVSSFSPKGGAERKRIEKPVTHKIQAPAQADPRDIWIAKSEQELLAMKEGKKNLENDLRTLRDELDSIKKKQKDEAAAHSRGAAGAVLSSTELPPPPSAVPTSSPAGALLPPPPGSSAARGGAKPVAPSVGIAEIVIPLPEGAGDEAETERTVDNFIPAGSFGRSILLSGLDAPTGGQSQNDPVPFVVKLKDNGRLPNGFRSRVRECHVVLAGYGDISSERVYGRTETLSCILKDGRVVETPLKGYIAGEDGKAGMRGRLVSKQGALIARSLLAGIAGGIGDGISQSYTTTSTSALGVVESVDTDRIAEQGLAEGLSTALDRVSRWYLERADETYPVIEVDAARMADIVLTQGTFIGEEALSRRSDGPRRNLVTEEDVKKAATLERFPWQKK